jgi:hypothetical protein
LISASADAICDFVEAQSTRTPQTPHCGDRRLKRKQNGLTEASLSNSNHPHDFEFLSNMDQQCDHKSVQDGRSASGSRIIRGRIESTHLYGTNHDGRSEPIGALHTPAGLFAHEQCARSSPEKID